MKLKIYNWNVLKKTFPDFFSPKATLLELLQKEFSVYNISNLSIIFVSKKEIRELNKDFRGKDSVTDVLSFTLDTEPFSGEVYVCPEFVNESYHEEEIVRDIVHGILHILGEDHSLEFTVENISKEKMFVKQENILQNILNEINNGVR